MAEQALKNPRPWSDPSKLLLSTHVHHVVGALAVWGFFLIYRGADKPTSYFGIMRGGILHMSLFLCAYIARYHT